MKHCTKCGGAIGEPGLAYGYAGKWCMCASLVNEDVREQMRQAGLSQPIKKFSDLEILLEFRDRQTMADEIKKLRELNKGLQARYESKEDVYYINGRKFCPVELLDKLERQLHQQKFNNKHNLSIDQQVSDRIEQLEVEVLDYKKKIATLMEKIADLVALTKELQ